MGVKPNGDLSDLDKVNNMISGAVNALLAQDFKYLSPGERQEIAEWMKNDPMVRERLARTFELI